MVQALSHKLILGIDTSCDETSAAVLKDAHVLLSNIISSQIKIHQPHGGVVPELASRAHCENIQRIIKEALNQASVSFEDLTGIAITTSPGLIGCLLVGLSVAKSLAYARQIPFTEVHHLKGHLFSPFVGTPENEIPYPFIGVVVSGGHTALYLVKSFESIELLGQTVDDACGEAYDKVAKVLGLGYPGGPLMDKLAQKGNPKAHRFTRARVKRGPLFLSYSGLKTAIGQILQKGDMDTSNPSTNPEVIDLIASFQWEAIEAIIDKIELTLQNNRVNAVVVSGGVACNSYLRQRVKELSESLGIKYLIPPPVLCTDNGAMIAYVGAQQLLRGQKSNWDANAHASKPLF